MLNSSMNAQEGQAHTQKKTFSRTTTVSIHIDADTTVVWALLTHADDYTRWNSTVTTLEGEIKEGSTLRLRTILDEKRTFTLKVKALIPGEKMIWGDGKGERVFTLTEAPRGGIRFTMTEEIGGLLFPLYARYIPPFDRAFEQFAADLKQEAEHISQTKKQ